MDGSRSDRHPPAIVSVSRHARKARIVLTAKDLTVEVGGTTIVRGASLDIRPGDKVGLVGRNGAGKTSLARIILGELAPAEGSASVAGTLGVLRQNPIPAPDSMVGHQVTSVGRRAKYLIFELDDGNRLLLHLSQAGRLDIEEPPKRTRPKGAAVRIRFDNGRASETYYEVIDPRDPGRRDYYILEVGPTGVRLVPEATAEWRARV